MQYKYSKTLKKIKFNLIEKQNNYGKVRSNYYARDYNIW